MYVTPDRDRPATVAVTVAGAVICTWDWRGSGRRATQGCHPGAGCCRFQQCRQ